VPVALEKVEAQEGSPLWGQCRKPWFVAEGELGRERGLAVEASEV
jgi:hypothetical protein